MILGFHRVDQSKRFFYMNNVSDNMFFLELQFFYSWEIYEHLANFQRFFCYDTCERSSVFTDDIIADIPNVFPSILFWYWIFPLVHKAFSKSQDKHGERLDIMYFCVQEHKKRLQGLLPSDWAEKQKSFLTPIRSQNVCSLLFAPFFFFLPASLDFPLLPLSLPLGLRGWIMSNDFKVIRWFCTAHLLLSITRWSPGKRACKVTLLKWGSLKRNAITIFGCGWFSQCSTFLRCYLTLIFI